jgi:hypothetical protein
MAPALTFGVFISPLGRITQVCPESSEKMATQQMRFLLLRSYAPRRNFRGGVSTSSLPRPGKQTGAT